MRNSYVIQSILIALSVVIAPPYARAESSEVPTQAHLELRGSYSQVCGTCIIFRKNNPYDASPRLGLQLYGDYLPFGWDTRFGMFRIGPYGSVSMIGTIEKIATGAVITFRPKDAFWEIFTQTGLRYTFEAIPFQYKREPGSQSKEAFNLAIGMRFYFRNNWYLSLTGEHDSNGSHVGSPLSKKDNAQNPGIDTVMMGLGVAF